MSLRAQDGRITGLLGPNGAGKSTTLRMLYTVLRPDAGDALIDGHSAVHAPLAAARRKAELLRFARRAARRLAAQIDPSLGDFT